MCRKLSFHKHSRSNALGSALERKKESSFSLFEESSALTISEDEKYVYIESYVPGIKLEEVEISLNQNTLWIEAVKKKDYKDKKKIFHCKAISSFSYKIPLPNMIDQTHSPEVLCKNGVLKIKFYKKNSICKKTPSKK